MYSIQDLRDRVPKGLKYAQNLMEIWQRTQNIGQACSDGIGWVAERKYKSHRRVSEHHVI